MRPPLIVQREERQRPAKEVREVILREPTLDRRRQGGAEASRHSLTTSPS